MGYGKVGIMGPVSYTHLDIDGNVMTYRRRKTGRLLTVTLVPEAMKLIKRYMNTDPASPYLFSRCV